MRTLIPTTAALLRYTDRPVPHEQDTLDVWFDSGCSWASRAERELTVGSEAAPLDALPPADLYLEGSDQHVQPPLSCYPVVG